MSLRNSFADFVYKKIQKHQCLIWCFFTGAITTLCFHNTLKVSDLSVFWVWDLYAWDSSSEWRLLCQIFILDCPLASDHTRIFKFHFCQLMIALIESKAFIESKASVSMVSKKESFFLAQYDSVWETFFADFGYNKNSETSMLNMIFLFYWCHQNFMFSQHS